MEYLQKVWQAGQPERPAGEHKHWVASAPL